jgi:tetratricopeptide (TPR) repeat protein
MKCPYQALAVFLLLGAVKLPVEQAATAHLRAAKLLSVPVGIGLRESLGQASFAASLGGLRSLVASITYLRAYREWENINWGKVDSLFQITTRLQPTYFNYWDEGAWHMAYNAASSYLYDDKIDPMLRGKLFDEHVQRGIDIILEGLRFLPDEPRLWNSLAEIYERRVHDPKKAAECYMQVFRISHNERYSRFAGYQYAQASDRDSWEKAYQLLKTAYDKKQRTPSVIDHLKNLEERLNTPLPMRIPDARPQMEIHHGEVGPVR